MIPDEAVEAAKEAMREVTPPPGVTKAEWLAKHGEFALIAGAIAAAAPHLAAAVWDEAVAAADARHERIEYQKQAPEESIDETPLENPYRKATK